MVVMVLPDKRQDFYRNFFDRFMADMNNMPQGLFAIDSVPHANSFFT